MTHVHFCSFCLLKGKSKGTLPKEEKQRAPLVGLCQNKASPMCWWFRLGFLSTQNTGYPEPQNKIDASKCHKRQNTATHLFSLVERESLRKNGKHACTGCLLRVACRREGRKSRASASHPDSPACSPLPQSPACPWTHFWTLAGAEQRLFEISWRLLLTLKLLTS